MQDELPKLRKLNFKHLNADDAREHGRYDWYKQTHEIKQHLFAGRPREHISTELGISTGSLERFCQRCLSPQDLTRVDKIYKPAKIVSGPDRSPWPMPAGSLPWKLLWPTGAVPDYETAREACKHL